LGWYTPGIHGFVDVRDVARIAVMLMNSDVAEQRFIVSGANIPFRDVFIKMANAFGKKPPDKKVTKLLSEVGWRASYLLGALTGKPTVLTKYSARTAMATVEYDNSKLLRYFPDFRYTDIDESIKRICGEYKEKYRL
jgi:nucleoside-diphosphate-sugar epimerase